jgi:hypothetical protein
LVSDGRARHVELPISIMRGTMRFRRTLSKVAVLAALFAVHCPPSQASAQIPPLTVGDQPASTLLLPYFEVDLKHPGGANTFFTVNNAAATATLVHVTVWSEMHVPVYGFDVYLTGYDVQPISVRDILNGVLPRTASAGQDPGNLITPKGNFSQDINYASCNGKLPIPTPTPATIAHIEAALTGTASPVTGQCATTTNSTPTIARGYITVDVTNACTSLFPGEAGYFINGGSGIAQNFNMIWGDYVQTNHLSGLDGGDGSPLVHIIANAADPQLNAPGQYTFYGRLHNFSAADNREPLSTTFMARYATVTANGFEPTQLTVWRDNKGPQGFFACGSTPAWYPLKQKQIIFFDEQERPVKLTTLPLSDTPTPFPAATQRVQVGGSTLPSAFASGTVYLNLMTTIPGNPNPPEDPMAEWTQAWVTVHQKGTGRYSIGYPAALLDSAKSGQTIVLPLP